MARNVIEEKNQMDHYIKLEGFQALLRTILNFGYKNGYIEKTVPISIVKNKSEPKNEMNFYTPEEFNLFISYVDHIVYNAFFTISYFCGLRKGETLGLLCKTLTLITMKLILINLGIHVIIS